MIELHPSLNQAKQSQIWKYEYSEEKERSKEKQGASQSATPFPVGEQVRHPFVSFVPPSV